MTPNPFGIVRAEFLHGRPRHAIFTVPGGEGIGEASKRRTLDTTRHLTCVPPRVCVNLSPGYHICSVTPSYATRSVRALPPRRPIPTPPHPHSSRVAVLFLSLSLSRPFVRPSVRPSAICLRFKTSGYLLHCLLTGVPTRGLRPRVHTHIRTHASIFIARSSTYLRFASFLSLSFFFNHPIIFTRATISKRSNEETS